MKIRNKLFLFLILPLLILLSFGFVTEVKDDYFEISKNLDIFGRLYREVNSLYVEETDPSKLMRIGVDAMLESLDPYTTYISEDELDDLTFMSTGEYGGIGALVQKREGNFVVKETYKDAPADRAGLKAGDIILRIGEKDLRQTGMGIRDIRNLLRGERSSKIDMSIQRPGVSETLSLSVMRDRIKVKNVPFAGMVDKQTAYIKLMGFTKDASREVQRYYELLKTENPQLSSLVLDLRGNPGGRLDEAVRIVNLFVSQKETVVETRGRLENSRRVHYAQRIPMDTEIPLAVLIDENSASASEIVAGALQDLDRALIVGQRSFGKGLVQNIRPLSYHTQLKVTTAKYYTPSGRCIQALNYGEKDKNGYATRIPDSLRNAFFTRNGRKVLDGGGIKPDLEIEIPRKIPLVESLQSEGVIFDFVTEYVKGKEQIASPREFTFGQEAFEQFVDFVQKLDFSYQTASDKELEKLESVIEREAYASQLAEEIAALKSKIVEMKNRDILKYQDQISWLIKEEILSRYYYQAGSMEASLDHDAEILRASTALANKKQYREVLQGVGN